MFPKLYEHKYKFAIFILLGFASIISISLAFVRMQYSDTLHYKNLVWNLILAWIPLLFATTAYISAISRKPIFYMLILGCSLVWLLFFPNAPYILTDFQHLSLVNDNVPVWFDVILLVWFAWTGLLLGMVSLYLMQKIIDRTFGSLIGWLFVFVSVSLGSLGIYLGRFERWNSWDVFQDPLPILTDFLHTLQHPRSNIRLLGFTLLFALFFLFIYLTLIVFGKLAHEQRRELN